MCDFYLSTRIVSILVSQLHIKIRVNVQHHTANISEIFDSSKTLQKITHKREAAASDEMQYFMPTGIKVYAVTSITQTTLPKCIRASKSIHNFNRQIWHQRCEYDSLFICCSSIRLLPSDHTAVTRGYQGQQELGLGTTTQPTVYNRGKT